MASSQHLSPSATAHFDMYVAFRRNMSRFRAQSIPLQREEFDVLARLAHARLGRRGEEDPALAADGVAVAGKPVRAVGVSARAERQREGGGNGRRWRRDGKRWRHNRRLWRQDRRRWRQDRRQDRG
eukprot:6203299-Pleurochrysis_carterae.AAC.3